MRGIIVVIAVLVSVFAGGPAEAKDYPKLTKGEVVLCKDSKVRVWEDGSASCVGKPSKVGERWHGLRVGDYVKCKKAKDVQIGDYKKGREAHCKK